MGERQPVSPGLQPNDFILDYNGDIVTQHYRPGTGYHCVIPAERRRSLSPSALTELTDFRTSVQAAYDRGETLPEGVTILSEEQWRRKTRLETERYLQQRRVAD